MERIDPHPETVAARRAAPSIDDPEAVAARYLESETPSDPYATVVPHPLQDRLADRANDGRLDERVRARATSSLHAAHERWLEHIVASRQLLNEDEDDERLRSAARRGLEDAIGAYDPTRGSFAVEARERMYAEMRRSMSERPVDRETSARIGRELRELEARYARRSAPREAADGERVYLRAVDRQPVLPYAVQDRLIAIGKDTRIHPDLRRRARDVVVLSNQRWIILKAHSREFRGRGVSTHELVQAGNEGLMEAYDKYVISRDNSFLTFAKHKIHMRMQRLSENDSAGVHGVRLPVDYYNFVHVTIKRAHDALSDELRRAPTVEEIHERVSRTVAAKNRRIEDERHEAAEPDETRPRRPTKPPTLAEVERGVDWLLGRRPISLQQRLGEDDGEEFGAILDGDVRLAERVLRDDASERVSRAFLELDDDERLVLGSCEGYGDYPDLRTMKRVAEHYDIKPATVKRLLESAKAKMRTSVLENGYNEGTT